jgi:hypothetical protein
MRSMPKGGIAWRMMTVAGQREVVRFWRGRLHALLRLWAAPHRPAFVGVVQSPRLWVDKRSVVHCGPVEHATGVHRIQCKNTSLKIYISTLFLYLFIYSIPSPTLTNTRKYCIKGNPPAPPAPPGTAPAPRPGMHAQAESAVLVDSTNIN